MGRIILAGIAGAIVMYIWASSAHAVLGLGNVGMRTMPQAAEDSVMGAIKGATGDQTGLYIAPGAAMAGNHPDTPTSGPSLFMVYRSEIPYTMSPMQLGGEFVLELIQSLILAFVLGAMAVSTGARIGYAIAAGVMAGIATNGSYHIWYGFPHDYTAAMIGIQIVEYLVAGIVIALVLPKRAAAA